MATISNLGVGSGLDLNSLYTQLQTAEQSKLTAISSKQASYQNQLSGYGKIMSAVQNLASATTALQKATTFNATSVTSANTAFTASTSATSTGGSAAAGTYAVTVEQLAKGQVLMSGTVASNTDQLDAVNPANGLTLSITQRDPDDTTATLADAVPQKISLTDGKHSLNDISDAINNSGGNVSASVIKAKDGEYHLMLTSKTTGASSTMSINVTNSDGSSNDDLNKVIGNTGSYSNMTEQTKGQDAKLTINGVGITRSSNTVTDALPGLTLNLQAVSAKDSNNNLTPENLQVTQSTGATKQAIDAWVSAYNMVQSTISNQTAYTAVAKGADGQSSSNGALIGDSTLRNIQTTLRNQLSSAVNGMSLGQMGITADPKTGVLSMDATKVSAAIAKDPQAIAKFFMGDGTTTGFATTLTTKLTNMTSSTGSIQTAQDGVTTTLKQLAKDYTTMSSRIDATMAHYKAQFTALDTMVSKLNATSSYLTAQFK